MHRTFERGLIMGWVMEQFNSRFRDGPTGQDYFYIIYCAPEFNCIPDIVPPNLTPDLDVALLGKTIFILFIVPPNLSLNLDVALLGTL